MEKDIGKISKNENTEIVVRIDDFGGRPGLTIREFVSSERYTGFTKAGVRIQAADFNKFKEMINSISQDDLVADESSEAKAPAKKSATKKKTSSQEELPDY
jgi:hypothetical protein